MDGTSTCEDKDKGYRINPKWRVLPAGRGPFEPTRLMPNIKMTQGKCEVKRAAQKDKDIEVWLQEQRRVVVQIVPDRANYLMLMML